MSEKALHLLHLYELSNQNKYINKFMYLLARSLFVLLSVITMISAWCE